MSLLQLPPEILFKVFGLLGPAFFHQHVDRLLVSRRWYDFALPAFYQDFELLGGVPLARFAEASKREAVLRSMQKNIRSVSLVLEGCENPRSTGCTLDGRLIRDPLAQAGKEWPSKFDGYLATFASVLQKCTKLRYLHLTAKPEESRFVLFTGLRRSYLEPQSLVNLLSITHLTSLEIDEPGDDLRYMPPDVPRVHLCDIISAMIPTLRQLRCRLGCICPGIFDFTAEGPVGIEEIVINMSLSNYRASDTFRSPLRCQIVSNDSCPQLRMDMESHARKLMPRLKSPRIFRILAHTIPGFHMHSFDVLTERRMKLAPAAAWDADGEEVEEPEETHLKDYWFASESI